MASFNYMDYYDFAESVRRKARHVLEESARAFLSNLIDTIDNGRRRGMRKGTVLWRAQRGHSDRCLTEESLQMKAPCAHGPERMTPLGDRATEGRVNPKGIPCLYLATDKETAMSEVRPWIGSYVTLAEFRTCKDLVLVDCSKAEISTRAVTFQQSSSEIIEAEALSSESDTWGFVNKAFSEPATRSDDVADYAPTQAMAEAFRYAGYHGVMFRSKLGKGIGTNVALFDVSDADVWNCTLYACTTVEFTFEQADNTEYIVEHYPDLRKKLQSQEHVDHG